MVKKIGFQNELIFNRKTFYSLQAIKDQFRLSHKELLSCELQLLVLLEFALQIPLNEVFPIYKRLETSNL